MGPDTKICYDKMEKWKEWARHLNMFLIKHPIEAYSLNYSYVNMEKMENIIKPQLKICSQMFRDKSIG